jgi:hypothetical protein
MDVYDRGSTGPHDSDRGTLLKNMRIFVTLFAAVLLLCPGLTAEESQKGVELSWALAAYRGPDDGGNWIEIAGEAELEAGDRISMMLETLEPCYVYVLHETDDDLKLLFPGQLPHKSRETEPTYIHFIPGKGRWLTLSNTPGEDAIHIVASREPLTDFSSTLESYLAEGADKETLRITALDQIAELQAKHFNPESVLRKPAAIGGALRDPERTTQVRQFASDIKAAGLFSESITLFH